MTADGEAVMAEALRVFAEATETFKRATESWERARSNWERSVIEVYALRDPEEMEQRQFFVAVPHQFTDGRGGIAIGLVRRDADGKEDWAYRPWTFGEKAAEGVLEMVGQAVERMRDRVRLR